AVPLGMIQATHKNSPLDYGLRGLTFFGVSMPNFWVGLLLMLFFCVRLKLLPVVCSGGDFQSMILPAVTLAFAMSAKYTRQVRTAILEELSQDYVVGARARGVKEWKILWINVFPNSLLPRSEEHTSELQSRFDLVCRLLLEKNKQIYII